MFSLLCHDEDDDDDDDNGDEGDDDDEGDDGEDEDEAEAAADGSAILAAPGWYNTVKDDEARPPRTAQRAVDPRGPMRPGGHGDANRRDNTCRGRRTPRWPAFSPWAILIYPATSLLRPLFFT